MAIEPRLEGGPIWSEAAFAFDRGCQLVNESNESLGYLLPLWAGREGRLSGETVRRWRTSGDGVPFWAWRGLWRCLRHRNWSAETLRREFGFEFID